VGWEKEESADQWCGLLQGLQGFNEAYRRGDMRRTSRKEAAVQIAHMISRAEKRCNSSLGVYGNIQRGGRMARANVSPMRTKNEAKWSRCSRLSVSARFSVDLMALQLRHSGF